MFGCKVVQLGICTDLELVHTFLSLFCADNGYMASWDPELLQESVNTLVNFLKVLSCSATLK